MKTTSIAHAKSHLSSLIQEVEQSEPIHLTKYGKPVAVIMSESDYRSMRSESGKLFEAIMHWREFLEPECGDLISDDEQQQWRDHSEGRPFAWDD